MKKVRRFFFKNYLILIFFSAIIFVGLITILKIFFVKPHYIYARVKISQGLWWANTARPQIWMVQSLKKGLKETDLVGNPIAEILSVDYYPWFQQGSFYDAYITLKLKVVGTEKGYRYARSPIAVGSAVNFEFPTLSVSGTVIEIDEKPIENNYKDKIIYLSKNNAQEWEYDNIVVGDKYYNGNETVFEILEKSATDENTMQLNFPPIYLTDASVAATGIQQIRKQITIKAKIKVENAGKYFIFAEEQVMSTGKDFYLALPSVLLNNYKITGIE